MDTLTICILCIVGGFGVIGLLGGLSKGVIRSLVTVATVVLSAVVALLLTPTLLDMAYGYAEPFVESLLADYAELMTASPTLASYLSTLATRLLAPVVFIVVFVLCLVVTGIVKGIVFGALKGLFKNKPNGISRLLGAVASALAGVVIGLCIVFPITGYFTALPTIYQNVKPIITNVVEVDETTEQTIIELPNGKAVSVVNVITGGFFDQLVSYEQGDEKVSALKDLELITSLVPPAMDFVAGANDIATMEVGCIKDINDIIGQSAGLRTIVAEVVKTAATNWKDNQPFMGFNLKEQLGDYASVAESVLVKLSNTTSETIASDLNDLADTIQTIQHVYVYINMLQNGIHTIEELEAQLVEVLASLTPESQALITDFVGDAVNGLFGENANSAIVVEIFTDVLTNEQLTSGDATVIANEATAINNIMHFATGDGEVSAEQLVDSLEQSQIVTSAVTSASQNATGKIVIADETQKAQIIAEIASLEEINPELASSLADLFSWT